MYNVDKISSIWGSVNPPPGINTYGDINSSFGGPGLFLQIIIRMLIIGAGIYSVFNFVLAGYSFLSAGDDPKRVAGAWAKIYQSIIGVVVATGGVVIAAIVSRILFDDFFYLLRFRYFTP